MASERKFVAENIRRVLLKEYFMRETQMAGFGGIDIQRTPMGTRVTLIVERPGMVIGRKGAKIKELTRVVSEKYGFDNPQIEVQECRNYSSNPQIMAQKLALALERGWHFRRAGHSTLRRIIESDVKGAQVKLCGKLTGQRHRTEKFKWGHIKFCGEPAITTMDRGYAIAKKKLGLIGVSVDIMRADARLPDEIRILDMPEIADLIPEEKKITPSQVEKEESSVETSGETHPENKPPKENDGKEVGDEKKRSRRKKKKEERRKTPAEASSDTSEASAEDAPQVSAKKDDAPEIIVEEKKEDDEAEEKAAPTRVKEQKQDEQDDANESRIKESGGESS